MIKKACINCMYIIYNIHLLKRYNYVFESVYLNLIILTRIKSEYQRMLSVNK